MTFLAMGHSPDPDPRTLACRRCGVRCVPLANDNWRHAKPICGAWMRYAREACARSAGHRGEHRTRYTMDCSAHARRAA